jgi:hypothetical protein
MSKSDGLSEDDRKSPGGVRQSCLPRTLRFDVPEYDGMTLRLRVAEVDN